MTLLPSSQRFMRCAAAELTADFDEFIADLQADGFVVTERRRRVG